MDYNLTIQQEQILIKISNFRTRIYLALTHRDNISISELNRIIGCDYKNTYAFVMQLNKLGIVNLNHLKNVRGQPVLVSLK